MAESESRKANEDQVMKLSASAEKSEGCSKHEGTVMPKRHRHLKGMEGYMDFSIFYRHFCFLLLLLKVVDGHSEVIESLKTYYFKYVRIS